MSCVQLLAPLAESLRIISVAIHPTGISRHALHEPHARTSSVQTKMANCSLAKASRSRYVSHIALCCRRMADPLAGMADLPEAQKRALEDAIEQQQVRDRCVTVPI